eukprot:2604648-Alexandrium_andersonii.AAC.1
MNSEGGMTDSKSESYGSAPRLIKLHKLSNQLHLRYARSIMRRPHPDRAPRELWVRHLCWWRLELPQSIAQSWLFA